MKTGLLISILSVLAIITHAQTKHPADYVNPFIGASTNIEKAGAAHGLGKTFPGAATPFGSQVAITVRVTATNIQRLKGLPLHK